MMQKTRSVQRAVMAGLATILLSGCIVSIEDNSPDGTEPVPPPPVPMVCDAASAQSHIGREATQSRGEAVLKDSGARSLRWGPPNSAWTMDYREDRVNVRYDAKMTIVEITCG